MSGTDLGYGATRICCDNLTCKFGCMNWVIGNVFCVCQLCGLVALDDARTVKGGKSRVILSGPAETWPVAANLSSTLVTVNAMGEAPPAVEI